MQKWMYVARKKPRLTYLLPLAREGGGAGLAAVSGIWMASNHERVSEYEHEKASGKRPSRSGGGLDS